MTYLVFMQQKFSPGSDSCHSARIVTYGDPLYLSIDLTHFIFRGQIYLIRFNRLEQFRGLHQSNARSGRKGPINVDFKKYIYDVLIDEDLNLEIVQINDVNTYLHNKYELAYIMFAGMRFEMVFIGEQNN